MSECFIEGSVDVENRNLTKLLEKHNALLEEQTKILGNISENFRDLTEQFRYLGELSREEE